MRKTYLSQHLLLNAPNNRHGICLEPQQAMTSQSDLPEIIHMGVPNSVTAPWESASGGVNTDFDKAKLAAIGEAIERYCASINKLPIKQKFSINSGNVISAEEWCLFTEQQRADDTFPFGNIYSDACPYTTAYDFQTNQKVWVPHPLIALRDDFKTGLPTSSGLAAGPTAHQALLRAIQELIERDALMITWLHSIPAKRIHLPARYQENVDNFSGEIWAFDLTPKYSPFPVIAIAGGIPKRGKWRYSLGVACREDWESALDKAFLEWNQGVLFAGIYAKYVDLSDITDPTMLKSFDEHAIYYSLYPEKWHSLPMFKTRDKVGKPTKLGKKMSTENALNLIQKSLLANNLRMYYRELTTIDADQLGIKVMRATSPDMASIFAHQEWQLLDKVKDLKQNRYPWASSKLEFPNPMPHPLG